MDDAIRHALAINQSSPARARTIEITTIGARTGKPRRIEIWFYRAGGRSYLSSLPAKPSWYANLKANPAFTFHLKNSVRADLAASARPVTDEAERQRIFAEIVDDLNQPSNPGGIAQPTCLEDWITGSPLMEVTFAE
jgi:deazaflavin-dependent oxidoreductase (nitroreductase family)